MDKKNSPDFYSKAYVAMQQDWRTVADCYAGTGAVRNAGRTYLPQFPKEDAQGYQDRLNNSVFYNVYRRTVSALVGMAFQREPKLETDVPKLIKELLENCDNAGTHWIPFAKELFSSAINYGHAVLYVDYPPAPEPGATLADEAGNRPYFIKYDSPQIINWRTEVVGGVTRLEQITFKEETCEPDGEFGEKEVTRFRVLNPGRWRLYEAMDKAEPVLIGEGTTSLPYIPVAVVYGQKAGMLQSCPPLKDLVDLNLAYYRMLSDLWNITHIANVPILFRTGSAQAGLPMAIGSTILFDEPTGATLEYVEHGGSAIGSTIAQLEKLETQMAKLGLSMLSDTSKEVTATEKMIDRQAESSELATMVDSLRDCLETALGFMADYLGLPDGGSVDFQDADDFMNLSAQDASMFNTIVKDGNLTKKTFLGMLERFPLIPEDFDPEDELSELEPDTPNPSMPGPMAQDGAEAGTANGMPMNEPMIQGQGMEGME